MEDNDRYFRLRFISSKGLISIHEKLVLSPNEYHLVKKDGTNDYQVLVEVEKTIGSVINSLEVFPEVYKTWEFKDVTYKIINNYDIDKFEYDKDKKVVIYGSIYGIYAVKSEDSYYDVITDEEIPSDVISRVLEIVTVDNYMEMIEDLKFIKEHKDIYIKLTRERVSKLLEGAMNKKVADELYRKNYETKKKLRKEKMLKRVNSYQQKCEEEKDVCCSKNEEVKQLIYDIKIS